MHTNNQKVFRMIRPNISSAQKEFCYYLKRSELSCTTGMNKPGNKQARAIAQQTNRTTFQIKTEHWRTNARKYLLLGLAVTMSANRKCTGIWTGTTKWLWLKYFLPHLNSYLPLLLSFFFIRFFFKEWLWSAWAFFSTNKQKYINTQGGYVPFYLQIYGML